MRKLDSKILRIQEIIGVSSMLMEASKKDILVKKLGIKEELADELDSICGGLSVIMTKKILNWYEDLTPNNRESATELFNRRGITPAMRQSLTSIMDWIRVGLNGNLNQYRDLGFNDLVSKSKEWHDSLQLGQGAINYEEKNSIIKDFRDERGNGFYWADLNTNSSDEECSRMGHCGRTGYGNTILSLREFVKIPGGKYTLNKSHLTAAVGKDGTLYQLKGPKNSKPKEEFHKYILPLFYVLGGGGEEEDYLIQGFGSEYASELDFKITDLPNETITELYRNRPELFNTRSLQRKLKELGLIDIPPRETTFTLELGPNEIGDYVDGDYKYSTRRWKDAQGNKRESSVYFFEMILTDPWEFWDNHDSADWESAVQYHLNNENETRIREYLLRDVDDRSKYGETETQELIRELDEDYLVRNALSSAVNDAEADDYVNALRKTLEGNLEFYGDVKFLNDDGAKIDVDLNNLISGLDEDLIDETFESCGDKLKCVLEELIYNGYIDKPRFRFDDRYYPDVDETYFNVLLEDRMSNFM
jgi:hypothetical protein